MSVCRQLSLWAWAGCLCWCAATARADSLVASPTGLPMSLQEAVQNARDGDTILVMPGEYNGQVAVITQKKLTLQGVGKRPVLRAGGRHAEGKGILVVRDGDVTLENIEFRSARVPDGNGAGVRLEKGRLLVRRCAFFDNEMGLLTGNHADAELTVEDSEFGDAPKTNGSLPHLLYAGRIAKLRITGSRFHEGFEGHLIKSRARESFIAYNMILDGWVGEASYEIDLPNGGLATIIGNVIGQGPERQNPVVVAYGSEGKPWPNSALYLSHNTLLSWGQMPAWFLRVWQDRMPPEMPLVVINNVAAGIGVLGLGISGIFEGNRHTLGRWLRAPNVLDFALPADSSLRGTAVNPTSFAGQDLSPKAEFQLPIGTRPIQAPKAWSPGAFQ